MPPMARPLVVYRISEPHNDYSHTTLPCLTGPDGATPSYRASLAQQPAGDEMIADEANTSRLAMKARGEHIARSRTAA